LGTAGRERTIPLAAAGRGAGGGGCELLRVSFISGMQAVQVREGERERVGKRGAHVL